MSRCTSRYAASRAARAWIRLESTVCSERDSSSSRRETASSWSICRRSLLHRAAVSEHRVGPLQRPHCGRGQLLRLLLSFLLTLTQHLLHLHLLLLLLFFVPFSRCRIWRSELRFSLFRLLLFDEGCEQGVGGCGGDAAL
ncbi:hypothetical protein F7725_008581 [Dissostichus mawsoni]|uniref:Uncharacterized protein n=1 Tax=Dissostichus mawsoni TaxID=36200 RepID=A0A7J5YAR5_DISMA|nr:hypothetical protein F7725_008581 [Dissostichus mawsoni]